jgi:hypothetical protein
MKSKKVKNKQVAIFEGEKIRRIFDEKKEIWYFSVVDIIQVLIQQADYQTARKYWNKLKERLKKEGNESVTNCHQLKLVAEDGKLREKVLRKIKLAKKLSAGKTFWKRQKIVRS